MRAFIIVLFLSFSLQAMELGWSHDYAKALQQAKLYHKIVYVLITSPDCRWCKKFERTTLQDKGIQKRLKEDFITVHLSRGWDDIPSKFKTAPIPRHYFVDATGKILYSSLGHRDVEMFHAFMDEAKHNLKIGKNR
jgi:hypothetical protein